MDASSSSSSSSLKCEIINEAILPPPPTPSDCENNKDGDTHEEDLEINTLSTSSSDCEDFSDGDTEEESEIDLIKAAMNGHAQIFDEPKLSLEHFTRKSVEENNILHIAVRYKQKEFVRALLTKKRYLAMNKKLISERNSHGNTPLHVAAQAGDENTVKLLYKYMKKSVEGGHDDDEEEKPWRAKNSQGNTALHLALLSGNFEVAKFLVERDGVLARKLNKSDEAPLHLAITHLDNPFHCIPMTEVLLEKARCVATWRDAKGLTPLLRAASLLHPHVILEVTKMIIDVCPESVQVCDTFGKSFLHLLMHNKIFDHLHQKNIDKQFKFDYEEIEDLICLNEISILKNHQDQDGHTPLHIALKCDNIHMARSLVSKCSADPDITNKDGISTRFMIQQLNLWHQLREPRVMTKEESSFANKGDIDFLLKFWGTNEFVFYGSQDDDGRNFLHLLMSKTTEHHNASLPDSCRKVLNFIEIALSFFPELVCQIDQVRNTPLHILAQNKDFCKTLAVQKCRDSSVLSKLLFTCADAITRIESRRTTTNEAGNHDQLPWVMQNADGNTPLHEAIIANNKVLVLELLRYSKESATIVNNHKETPLHLLAATDNSMEEFTVEEITEMVKTNSKALGLQDKNGLTPISRAIKAMNVNVVVTLLCNFQEFSNTNGHTLWQIYLENYQSNYFFLDKLLQREDFRKMLKQKSKDGNTALHIAIQEKCLVFVRDLLETWGSERESSERNKWLMDLLKIPNNVGETSEDLLADLPTLSRDLEEKLLTDPRMRGIRSSWRIPRTQLQNYMKSINVIAALQTTITFTAAFVVPGGLIQDKGFPIFIQSIAFQVFMISDVMAMCLSMMVLICPFWMVSGTKRKSVEIQDFTLLLLQLSFVATLLTFMTGVFATIYPVKRWIAITTLVLCSLLTLLLHKFIVTKLLLPFHHATVNFVKKLWDPAVKKLWDPAVKKLWDPASAFCCKIIKNSRSWSNESEHTHLNNPDRSPDEHNNV